MSDERTTSAAARRRAAGAIGLGLTIVSVPLGRAAERSRSGETITQIRPAPASRAASIGQATIGRPQISCMTLGTAERMRVSLACGHDQGHWGGVHRNRNPVDCGAGAPPLDGPDHDPGRDRAGLDWLRSGVVYAASTPGFGPGRGVRLLPRNFRPGPIRTRPEVLGRPRSPAPWRDQAAGRSREPASPSTPDRVSPGPRWRSRRGRRAHGLVRAGSGSCGGGEQLLRRGHVPVVLQICLDRAHQLGLVLLVVRDQRLHRLRVEGPARRVLAVAGSRSW